MSRICVEKMGKLNRVKPIKFYLIDYATIVKIKAIIFGQSRIRLKIKSQTVVRIQI